MDHYKHPRNFGELPNADVVLAIDNPLCGDKLKLQIKFRPPPTPPWQGESVSVISPCQGGEQEGVVEDVKFSGEGCAISVASASLFTEYLKNKTRAELLVIDDEVIYKLLGVDINAGRAKCALLPLVALRAMCAPAFTNLSAVALAKVEEGVRGR